MLTYFYADPINIFMAYKTINIYEVPHNFIYGELVVKQKEQGVRRVEPCR